MSENGYILTEIWSAKTAWLALGPEERVAFFDDKIGPFLGEMVGAGADILACVLNDNDGEERLDHDYMAIWRVKDKAFADRIVAGAKAAGFMDYFEQVNISGTAITPMELNAAMISR